MQRGRLSKEGFNAPSSIPRRSINNNNNRRSSSIDCIQRGSYLPPVRRTSSADRLKTPRSTMKQSNVRASPRVSASGIFAPLRGSLVDRKRAVLKDNRLLSDKAYQRQCVTDIVQFLEENNFPYQIQVNRLMNPQKKDYEMIFQFLINWFDPKYEVRRIEEDGPKVLKTLGYPFPVTKSTFLSVTRMSWPSLLGTLVWLLKMVKCSQCIIIEDFLAEKDFGQEEQQKVLLNFLLVNYRDSIEDPDKEDEIFASLSKQLDQIELSEDEIKAQIHKVQREIENEKKEQRELDLVIECSKCIDNDIANYQNFISKMDNHLKQKGELWETVKKTLAEKEIELKGLKEAVLEKEKQYKAQGYDGQKAHNLYMLNKKSLNEKLEEAKSTFGEEESSFWDLEIELSHLRDEIEAQCQRFNIAWQDLNAITENASNPLGSVTLPAAKKVFEKHKAMFPDLLIRPRSTTDAASALEKIEKHMVSIKEELNSITAVQKQHLSELETKRSSAKLEKNLASAVFDEKKRESELKASLCKNLIQSKRDENTNLQRKLKFILEEQVNLKSAIEEVKILIKEKNVENTQKLYKWKCIIDNDDKYIRETAVALSDTIRQIEAQRKMAHDAMQDDIKELDQE